MAQTAFYTRKADFLLEGLYPLAVKMGLDPEPGLLVDVAFSYVGFLNNSIKKLHDRFDFPDWILIEQRTPDANHYIAFEQVSQKIIDRALKVYQRDPRVTIPQFEIPFRLDSNGVHVGYNHGTSVWLKYMEPAPCFTGTTWSAATTYQKNQGVSITNAQLGADFYRSLQDTNLNKPPAANPTWWEQIVFPESVADLVVRLAFSEALREDGQFDKAASEESAVIQEAISKVGAMVNVPFDTVTDQSRPASRYRPPGFNVPFSTGNK